MLGVDIVKISRIKKVYEKFNEKFLFKIFNDEEILYIKERNYNIETISGLLNQ